MHILTDYLPTSQAHPDKLFQEWFHFWAGCADQKQVQEIKDVAKTLPQMDATIGDTAATSVVSNIRVSKVTWIHHNEQSKSIYNFITERCDRINFWNYGFKLNAVEALQFTDYALNGHYDYHNDICIRKDNLIRKLSMVLCLSHANDYQGGELCLLPHGTNPKEFKLNYGDLIAFPSWVPHKVKPVTEGHRQTLVAWACGPKFQ